MSERGKMRRRRVGVAVAAASILLPVLVTGAQAEFPYPAPGPNDPYDYGAYMRLGPGDPLPHDLKDDELWKYSSKRACELYPGNPAKCDPLAEALPQELHQVTGASVDKAWRTSTGRPDVVIAVHDSGIEWDSTGGKGMANLNNKTWLNRWELPVPDWGQPHPQDTYDRNSDGVFNIKDFCPNWEDENDCGGSGDSRVRGDGATGDTDLNKNGIIDPEDLIFLFSDGFDGYGADTENNGYVDDFVGWDAFEDDNDPYDEVHYEHGTGEAYDSTAEANTGPQGSKDGVGTCPNCMVMHMRVGDSFIADVNDFAQGVLYATDNGASVIQSALGTLNNSRFAQEAIDYAYRRGVILIASAADESAGHHNQPSVLEHGITFNASGEPQVPGSRPATYMEFRGCTNWGAYVTATVPANSCSSEAVGRSAGMVGLAYATALNELDDGALEDYGTLDGEGGVPAGRPISAEEVAQLVRTTADDYNFTDPPYTDRTIPETKRYPATPGWDPFFGHGRINNRRIVEAIAAGLIPPEVYVEQPNWFEIVDPDDGPVEIEGFVASRRTAAYSYKVEWAPWSWKGPVREAYQQPQWRTAGVTQTTPPTQDRAEPLEGQLATIDNDDIAAALEDENPDRGHSGPPNDPATGRGENENAHWPDRFGIVVRVIATAKDAQGQPVLTPFDSPEGGGDPNADLAASPGACTALTCARLRGESYKNFHFHDDPSLFPGFPRDMVGDGAAAPRFADLDDDGVDELVVATSDGEVHAYKSSGGEAEGWPVRTTPYSLDYDAPAYGSGEITLLGGAVRAAVLRSPTIADIDRDGDVEVLVTDFEGRLSVFTNDGQMMPGFPVRSDPSYSSPQPEDRAAGFYDDHPELIEHGDYPGGPDAPLPNDPDLVPDLVNRRLDGQYNAFEDDGSDDPNRTSWWLLASATAANLDADKQLEILAGAGDGHVYQWEPDGTLREGWPVKLRDPAKLGTADSIDPVTHMVLESQDADRLQGGPVIVSPAVGDIDKDGSNDIVATVNEEYSETPNTDDKITGNLPAGITPGNNRVYRLFRDGSEHEPSAQDPGGPGSDSARHPHDAAYVKGWPARIASLQLELLPVVGEGPDGAPVLADALQDPGMEISIFGTAGPAYVLNGNGVSVYGKDERGRDRTLQTDQVGAGSNSPDTPSIPAVGGAIFSRIGPGPYTLVVPAAGLGKLLDVVLPEDQLVSDNHIAVYDLSHPSPGSPGYRGQVPAYPREVNDLQFLSTAASADIDGDDLQEILGGSAYSDLHAFDIAGDEPGLKTLDPDGWPKLTGGWTVAPPAVGDWDDDGKRDVAHVIREGFLFAWKGDGAGACAPASWPEYGHDPWNSNNAHVDAVRPERILDLKVMQSGAAVQLTWTATGDDRRCGDAHSYEVRRSTQPITNENFSSAQLVARPQGVPEGQQIDVSTVAACQDAYYAVRAYDGDRASETQAQPVNPSAVSNNVQVSAVTEGCEPVEEPPPPQIRTSLDASPPKVAYRAPVTVGGTVDADAECSGPFTIDLSRRVLGTQTWKQIRSDVAVGDDGRWSVGLRPQRSAMFRAQVDDKPPCEGRTSPTDTVRVRVRIDITRAECNEAFSALVRGSVRPRYPGTSVWLERRKDGAWKRVDREDLNDRSRFELHHERGPRKGCNLDRYRVVWPKQSRASEPTTRRL